MHVDSKFQKYIQNIKGSWPRKKYTKLEKMLYIKKKNNSFLFQQALVFCTQSYRPLKIPKRNLLFFKFYLLQKKFLSF